MKISLSKVLRVLRQDFVQLSDCCCNGMSIVVESVKKTPRHIPEGWSACYHIQLNGLTVGSVEVFDLAQTVKLVFQRWVPNYVIGTCTPTGKLQTYTLNAANVGEQLSRFTDCLAKHIRKQSGLPGDSTHYPLRWTIVFAAKTVEGAKVALQEAIRDLDANHERCNMNGCHDYALTLSFCPIKRRIA